jgi:hypothetical protein
VLAEPGPGGSREIVCSAEATSMTVSFGWGTLGGPAAGTAPG